MKNNIPYVPRPMDMENILIPDGVSALVEEIAENLHDLWARKRIDEGWTYGEERSDRFRQTPCLIPYACLPEQEKEYDRSMVLATIKSLLAMGYRLERAH